MLKPTTGFTQFGEAFSDCSTFTIGLSAFETTDVDLSCGLKSFKRDAKLTEFEVLGCDSGMMGVFEFVVKVGGIEFWEIYYEF